MSDLKRKREDEDEPEASGDAAVATTYTGAADSTSSAQDDPSAVKKSGEGDATVDTTENDTSGHPARAESASTITICGKEVALKGTAGRKKRKYNRDALILMAYKGHLARMCKADNMVSALEIYREMKSKKIVQDLETHLMILAVCGGSPGGRDELDPGNGVNRGRAALTKGANSSQGMEGGSDSRSARKNTSAAADAAIEIFADVLASTKQGLPESAYTSVIRACCLDSRADKARDTLNSLTNSGGLPRLRTYAPLIEAYTRQGLLRECMSVWREATSPPHEISMTEREYLLLIEACTAARDQKCFEDVMKEYMEDVLQPRSRASWDVIKAWFRAASAGPPAGPGTEKETAAGCGGQGVASGGDVKTGSEGPEGSVGNGHGAGTGAVPCSGEQVDEVAAATEEEAGKSVECSVRAVRPDDNQEHSVTQLTETPGAEAKSTTEAPGKKAEGAPGSSSSSDASARNGNCGGRDDGKGEALDGEAVGAASETGTDGLLRPDSRGEAVSDGKGKDHVDAGGDTRWCISECTVADDGSCKSCGEKLQSIELSEDDEQRLRKQIEVLVCTNEERTEQWKGYCGWLERRGRDRYKVIIDGANVGYFKQNAADAGELADLTQIDWAVRKYEAEGKKPLVVLHSRHLVGKRLPDEHKEILKRWRASETIQSCAPRNNDDWYWLYAAVFTGGRVLVLTNDEMRDHHFSMLSHRSFERWKERHQARFCFGEWTGDMREVLVEEPSVYSKRSQRSDKSWHFPLKDSKDWLCVRSSEV